MNKTKVPSHEFQRKMFKLLLDRFRLLWGLDETVSDAAGEEPIKPPLNGCIVHACVSCIDWYMYTREH